MYENQTKKQLSTFLIFIGKQLNFIWFVVVAIVLYACDSSSGNSGAFQQPPQSLAVITVSSMPAKTYQEFTASLQGRKDIEIRPQVDGYLDKIYIDEGAHVRKGQPLFHINVRPYREQVNSAKASLSAGKANLANAE